MDTSGGGSKATGTVGWTASTCICQVMEARSTRSCSSGVCVCDLSERQPLRFPARAVIVCDLLLLRKVGYEVLRSACEPSVGIAKRDRGASASPVPRYSTSFFTRQPPAASELTAWDGSLSGAVSVERRSQHSDRASHGRASKKLFIRASAFRVEGPLCDHCLL